MLPVPAIRTSTGLRARVRPRLLSAARRVDSYTLWAFNPRRGR